MTAKIKADTETLMHLKDISIIIIIFLSLLFTACTDDSKDSSNSILQDNSIKYDFVYNEPAVLYSIYRSYDTILII